MNIRNRFEFVNGGRIVAQHHTPGGNGLRAGRYIIVRKGHNIGEYVTAWQGVGADGQWDTGWHHGNYCRTYAEAVQVFTDKIKGPACAPGVILEDKYYCDDCDPQDENAAYILVAQGQKCVRCPRVVDDRGQWHKRDSIDALKEAVGP